MGDTKISWTDKTWNPVSGCSHVSEGCRNCYAERLSLRYKHTNLPWTAQNAAENVVLHPERLEQPLHWRKPCRVFVNSMSDLFHEQVPEDFIFEIFSIMRDADRHIFQVLTKRPQRMVDVVRKYYQDLGRVADVFGLPNLEPLSNVWLGVSVEDQRTADERIPLLLQTPAAVRFLSCEPLLGPITFRPQASSMQEVVKAYFYGQEGYYGEPAMLNGIHWVIVGGESGPHFREMDLDWARYIRDQCIAEDVAFWFKQSSGFRSEMNPTLDGVEWHQFPNVHE